MKGCNNFKEKIREAEAELARDSFKRKIEAENKAIEKCGQPKVFLQLCQKDDKEERKDRTLHR